MNATEKKERKLRRKELLCKAHLVSKQQEFFSRPGNILILSNISIRHQNNGPNNRRIQTKNNVIQKTF